MAMPQVAHFINPQKGWGLFVFDFWGYTSLSVLFIIGGIILILGGWLIEKWRRKLLEEIQ